jgi:hypothetical protein
MQQMSDELDAAEHQAGAPLAARGWSEGCSQKAKSPPSPYLAHTQRPVVNALRRCSSKLKPSFPLLEDDGMEGSKRGRDGWMYGPRDDGGAGGGEAATDSRNGRPVAG